MLLVCPIYKSGNKSEVKNYRGVSIQSDFHKIMEAIIADVMFQSFRFIVNSKQHGFYKSRSTLTHLSVYENYITGCMESAYQVDSVYTDLC